MTDTLPSALPKGWKWKQRIRAESAAASKTIFLTLTFRPRGSLPFVPSGTVTASDIDRREYPEVQKFLKRVRQRLSRDDRCNFRYLCAPEFGGVGGRLHYHVLLHLPAEVPQSFFRSAWTQGQTNAKNVSGSRVANYVAKYIGKQGLRCRASTSYGVLGSRLVHSRVVEHDLFRAVSAAFGNARIENIRAVPGRSVPRLLPLDTLEELEDDRTNRIRVVADTSRGIGLFKAYRGCPARGLQPPDL